MFLARFLNLFRLNAPSVASALRMSDFWPTNFNHKVAAVIKVGVYANIKTLSAPHFIISRAGAASISELSCLGKPVMLIPSPNVTANHQYYNAMALVREKAALMLEEKDLENKFDKHFSFLINDKSIQKDLRKNIKRMSRKDAARNIVKEIIELHGN